jgi:hypothetical protein
MPVSLVLARGDSNHPLARRVTSSAATSKLSWRARKAHHAAVGVGARFTGAMKSLLGSAVAFRVHLAAELAASLAARMIWAVDSV